MKKVLETVVSVAVFWGLLYLTLTGHYRMAANVFKFMAWATFGLSIITALAATLGEFTLKRPSWMQNVLFASDFFGALYLAAYGWFGYAVITLLTGFFELWSNLPSSNVLRRFQESGAMPPWTGAPKETPKEPMGFKQ